MGMPQQAPDPSMLMPSPPPPSSYSTPYSHEPDVHVSTVWPIYKHLAPSGLSVLPMETFGYSPQHLQYAAQCQWWSAVAWEWAVVGPPGDILIANNCCVWISCREQEEYKGQCFRSKYISFIVTSTDKPLQSICEGVKNIPANGTAQELAAITLLTLVPHIIAYCPDFTWQETKFAVQDKGWVNLSMYTSEKLYFYGDCLHGTTHKNSKIQVFKAGKLFLLFVVVP